MRDDDDDDYDGDFVGGSMSGFRISVRWEGEKGRGHSTLAGCLGQATDSQSLNKTFMAFALIDGAKFSVQ